jgi:hypothetical protein
MSLEHSPARGGERCAFTISEFCNAHRISRSKFYILKNKGLGPRVTDVDGKQIITIEDAATWRRERAEEAAVESTRGRPGKVDAASTPAPIAAEEATPIT